MDWTDFISQRLQGNTRLSITAAAVAVALAGGAALAAPPPAASSARPQIILGTKNFPEAYVLGELYKQALEAKGYSVSYDENIGSTEIIDGALTSGKINFYPDYTGTLVQVVFHRPVPDSATAAYALAKRLEAARGFTLLSPTPFSDSDEIAVPKSTAARWHLRTIGDLRRLPGIRLGGLPESRTRFAGLIGLRRAYGLDRLQFVPLTGLSVYQLMNSGKLGAGFVFSTDPELGRGSRFTVLADDRHIFGFQNAAPVVSSRLVRALGKPFVDTVDRVSGLLTLNAIIAMNHAVVIDKQRPADVATAFLQANHLSSPSRKSS